MGGGGGVRKGGKVPQWKSNILNVILLVKPLMNFMLIQKLCSFFPFTFNFWAKVAFFVQTACFF